jgi:uncharacterized protein (TIGR00290 family)
MREPVILSWSGGKDSALAWDWLARSEKYEVVALLTTLTQGDERICMHGVRRELLQAQADALRVPLEEVFIPPRAENAIYEGAVGGRLERFRRQGVKTVAFGDLFLRDIREYREACMARIGMRPLFPLWEQETEGLATEFLDRGWRAVVCCCDGRVLDAKHVGRWYDRSFLNSLETRIDPCGENGEFHTFTFDGPGFPAPILFRRGAVSQSGPFWYCDLSLVSPTSLCA